MSLIKILIEGRRDVFMSKFANKFSPEQLQQVIETSDVVPNQDKYLNFIGTVINPKNFQDDLSIVVKLLQKFSTVGPNLEKKDINQYQTIKELKTALSNYENRVRREVKNVEGADVIYEDDNIVMVHPKTYQASCHYGAGTKWCTTSSSSTFESYQKGKKLFYIIDKKKPTSDRFYKIAILYNFDGNQTFYDAPDKSFNPENVIPKPILDKLIGKISAYIQTEYADEYSDYLVQNKERIKREKEAAERERLRLVQIRAEQEERRETQAWNLELYPDDDEAIRANALFTYLVNNEDIDPLTPEDVQEKIRLEQELARLMEVYENTENSNENTDLVANIAATEEAILEINNKEDVYVLIPEEYGHWGLTSFSYFDQDWSIGTESEFDEAAYESVKSLYDDTGLEGFNENFVENFLDQEQIYNYLRDFFSSDVYDNPEIYLNDGQRQLSSSQLREIEQLEDEFTGLQDELSEIEDDTEYEDRIEEIKERINEIPDEIEEIRDNPDGDFSEDDKENVIDGLVDDNQYDLRSFVSNYIGTSYMDFISQFIDERKFIEGIIEADGYGPTLNTYDGDYDTQRFNDTTYYIIRYN